MGKSLSRCNLKAIKDMAQELQLDQHLQQLVPIWDLFQLMGMQKCTAAGEVGVWSARWGGQSQADGF